MVIYNHIRHDALFWKVIGGGKTRKGKRRKGIQTGKEEVKLSLVTEMTLLTLQEVPQKRHRTRTSMRSWR